MAMEGLIGRTLRLGLRGRILGLFRARLLLLMSIAATAVRMMLDLDRVGEVFLGAV